MLSLWVKLRAIISMSSLRITVYYPILKFEAFRHNFFINLYKNIQEAQKTTNLYHEKLVLIDLIKNNFLKVYIWFFLMLLLQKCDYRPQMGKVFSLKEQQTNGIIHLDEFYSKKVVLKY